MLRSRSRDRTYTLRQRIAAGGMGEVYSAVADDSGRPVAIKRMLEQTMADADLFELFLREMTVAATLEHHNVAEVLDFGQVGPELFLVMEFVEGPTLAEVLGVLRERGERPSLEVALGIATQIAQGLAHAHERALPDGTPLGIVHRDIAPENVLVGTDGVPKLVDFGLAKLDGQTLTQPGVIRGRPRSLAPEQARGDDTDARTDIFALGAILFELIAGDRLYPDEALATLLWKVAAGDYEPIAQRVPEGTDPDLVAIIERAVAPDANDRPRSARQVERELGAFRAAREIRVSSGEVAELVARVWPEAQRVRAANLDGSHGELDGRTLILPADPRATEPEPVAAPPEPEPEPEKPIKTERWKRPARAPRPAGWDKVTPLPDAPAKAHTQSLRAQRWWTAYGVGLLAATILVFWMVWRAAP